MSRTTASPSIISFNNYLKLKIPVLNFQRIFALRNGDIVRGSDGFIVEIYDSNTGSIKRTLTSSYTNPSIFGQLSNGDLVVGYKVNQTILIWDLNIFNGEPVKKIIQTDEIFFSLTVLKNDDLVIGQFYAKDIVIRDYKTGLVKKRLSGHTSDLYEVIELEDGNLISNSLDGTVKIWNITTSLNSSLIKSIKHEGGVYSFAILKNGNLASGLNKYYNNTGDIEIRNIETTELIRTLTGHTQRICYHNCLKVLDDGDLISGSFDGKIKIWNPYSGSLKLTVNQHSSSVRQLLILPNGKLVSASNTEILIWS